VKNLIFNPIQPSDPLRGIQDLQRNQIPRGIGIQNHPGPDLGAFRYRGIEKTLVKVSVLRS